ncbi:hypothetical protein HPB51_011232 [Rhipicephalus microplus]|uniref:Uncharacterized protein n=1 Tax=Rhipicephalus microplus TaxID=6941 RepID=A0A9J6F352_RHIMP|nr:hypothetical protein HPB51_011232 [Rhipicephalus microplus]
MLRDTFLWPYHGLRNKAYGFPQAGSATQVLTKNGSGDDDTIGSLVNWSYVERPVVDSFVLRSLRPLTRATKAPCKPGSQLPAVTMPVIVTSLHKKQTLLTCRLLAGYADELFRHLYTLWPFTAYTLQCCPSWNKLTFATEQDAVQFGLCELEGEQADHMLLPKWVKFKPAVNQPESLCCCVYLRGHLYSQRTVSSPEEAQTVLDSTNSLVLCGGCGMKPGNEKRYVSYAGSYYSIKCTYACDSKGPCLHCKYLRKLLQNQLSRKKRNGGASKRLKRHANTRRSLRTARKKLLNAERQLAGMRQENEAIADDVLNERIKCLPVKQQLAVKTCFEA